MNKNLKQKWNNICSKKGIFHSQDRKFSQQVLKYQMLNLGSPIILIPENTFEQLGCHAHSMWLLRKIIVEINNKLRQKNGNFIFISSQINT